MTELRCTCSPLRDRVDERKLTSNAPSVSLNSKGTQDIDSAVGPEGLPDWGGLPVTSGPATSITF